MTRFFKKSQTVAVSRITSEGWWIENCQEHVAKGTALGSDFTENIYTPSKPGMIAKYDRSTQSWSDEITDMTWKTFYSEFGECFYIGEPDGAYPEWAIKETPPEYDIDIQTVHHKEKTGWKVYPIQIGRRYYDEEGNELVVSDYNFDLPENHAWIAPPEASPGFAYRLKKGEWTKVVDHRGCWAFAKNRNQFDEYTIEKLGPLPDTHTLEPPEEFDSWAEGKGWQYDIERHKPVKAGEERRWRDQALTQVLNRIEQYQTEQAPDYPVSLRSSPIDSVDKYHQLLADKKRLCDYPDTDGFPFCERPELSGLA